MRRNKTTLKAAGASVLFLSAALSAASPASAERLDAVVRDQHGERVSDAVVYAVPLDQKGEEIQSPRSAVVDQIDKEYVPYVTAVRVGTRVRFPNHDQIRHHVYSFSEAKTFEIPLYKGTPAEPVEFDRVGEVALGCNIHDWMRAYVFVTAAPYFSVTNDRGEVNLALAPGEYNMRVWHPELAGDPKELDRRLSLSKGGAGELSFVIERRPVWRPRRSPSMLGPGYR